MELTVRYRNYSIKFAVGKSFLGSAVSLSDVSGFVLKVLAGFFSRQS